MKKQCLTVIYLLLISLIAFLSQPALAADSSPNVSTVVTLDGPDWLLGTDPQNQGKDQKWWLKPIDGAKQVPVPGIIQDQDAFPEYHGVAWYWKDFTAPKNPHPKGHYILKFWSVDYKADVWVNDVYFGEHKVQEAAFEFDVTKAIKPGAVNTEIDIALPGGDKVAATVTNESVETLGLRKGQTATAVFKAGAVILGIQG